jgi:iron(II)-dependent oxidoreductase
MLNLMKKFLLILVFIAGTNTLFAQEVKSLATGVTAGLSADRCLFTDGSEKVIPGNRPLFSVEIDGQKLSSSQAKQVEGEKDKWLLGDVISFTIVTNMPLSTGWKGMVTFRNEGKDTVSIANVVPLGASNDHVYIASIRPWYLANARIFRPGFGPIGITLPDNAWELGYSSVDLDRSTSLCMLARRTKMINSERRRYETLLPPGTAVEYTFYAESFSGLWQNGLKRIFQERYLYDLPVFDETLYNRPDQQWIRHSYLITLLTAWDHAFYERDAGKYAIYDHLKTGKKLMGGYDIFFLWPTFPELGLDQRNQWDLHADLPWGLEKLKEISNYAKQEGTRFFVPFNPWDESTRKEDPAEGLARVISATNIDGVFLDTYGWPTAELQRAADKVKPGVVMYSEGQMTPKDMQLIVAGRVHDAIYLQPPLNMNKRMKPQHAIFRVLQLSQGRLHRESCISFFNGYGSEINTFAPGRPDWIEEEYLFLGRTLMTLRENTSAFTNNLWTPLVPTLHDSIWVNQWQDGEKTIYTIYSLLPGGFDGSLFEAPDTLRHFVSLWNHEEIQPVKVGKDLYLPVHAASFNRSWLTTRMEGNVECVAALPSLMDITMKGDSLFIKVNNGSKIRIWKGMPSYQGVFKEYPASSQKLSLVKEFGRYYGKYVIQLFSMEELADERVMEFKVGTPWLASIVVPTKRVKRTPQGMLEIPAGEFLFSVNNDEQYVPYPDFSKPRLVKMPTYFMDRYPVTNAQFYDFLVATGYKPADPVNFLKHWKDGMYPEGQGNFPVVYVSLEDARAYATWAEKRLPTEIEWQYAAQGTDGRAWPWGKEFYGTKCNNSFDQPTPVDAFEKGKSPFKVEDMVGNVWQLTNDVYENGSNSFVIIRGGSYFNPTTSMWYIKGGPQPLTRTQMQLLVSPGYDRCATVGFRCVKDAE